MKTLYLDDLLKLNSVECSRYLLDLLHTDTHVDFVTKDASFSNIRVKQLLLNMYIFRVKASYGQAITKMPIGAYDAMTKNVFSNALLDVYMEELMKFSDPDVYPKACEKFFHTAEDITNFIIVNCAAYSRSVDILGIAKFKNSKEFKETIHPETYDFSKMTITEAEVAENEIKRNLQKLLKEVENPFMPFMRLNILNLNQVYNTLIAVGYKSDVNDRIMPKYIDENYADGIKDDASYVFESLAPRRSGFYNKAGIQSTRYFERLMQQLASNVRNLYFEDCGTKLTVPFTITKKNAHNVFHKIIIVNGQEIILEQNNYEQFVGKTVNMRSPLTCAHTDGVCAKCAGLLSYFSPSTFTRGVVAAVEAIEPVSQTVLSAKHHQQAQLIEWNPDNPAVKKYFYIHGSEIFVSDYGRDYQLVVDSEMIKTFLNVPEMKDGKDIIIDETIIPQIPWMKIYHRGMFQEEVLFKAGVKPHFSLAFVEFYKNNRDIVTLLDKSNLLIDLKNFPKDKPIMAVDMLNDSMLMFFSQVQSVFAHKLASCTTCQEALEMTTNVIWRKVQINVTFVETILKACLVTGEHDFRIPLITDPNNVMFNTITPINMFRSPSVSLTHERHLNVFGNMDFYKSPLTNHDFDRIPLIEGL